LRRFAIKSGWEKKDLRLLYAMVIAPNPDKLSAAAPGSATLFPSDSDSSGSMLSTSSEMSFASTQQNLRKDSCRDFSLWN
jgi:hypothetical protein